MPQAIEDRLDFFVEGEDDIENKEDSKSGGQKKVPLTWWGIIEPPQDILDKHENLPKEYQRDRQSGSKRRDRKVKRDEKQDNVIHDQRYGYGGTVQNKGSVNRVDHYHAYHSGYPDRSSDRHGGGRGPGFAPPPNPPSRLVPSRDGPPSRNYGDSGGGQVPIHQDPRGLGERGFPSNRYDNSRPGHHRKG